MPRSSVPGTATPGEGLAGSGKPAPFIFISLMMEEEKDEVVTDVLRFLLLCKIHLIVDPLLGGKNNLFIPSCAATVCTTLNFQKQLGLRQREKPSFLVVDRGAGR